MTICYDVFWSSSPWALIIYTTYTPSFLPHPSTRDISLALLYDDIDLQFVIYGIALSGVTHFPMARGSKSDL